MKNLIILFFLIPLFGIAQTEIRNKKASQSNHLDIKSTYVEQENLINPLKSIWHKSLAPLNIKMASENKYLLDSVYAVSFNSPMDSTIGYKEHYGYDKKGNRIVTIRFSACNECPGPGTGKTELAFDDNGNCTSSIWYKWDINTKLWVAIFKIEQTYDFDSRPILYFVMKNDKTDVQWINSEKIEYSYSNNGILFDNTHYIWDSNVNLWIISSKVNKQFNENGNIILSTSYTYDVTNNQFVGSKKEEHFYENNIETILVQYIWDKATNQWLNVSKYESNYDLNGNNTRGIIYNWESNINEWKALYKNESNFTLKGQTASSTSFDWDNTNNQWIVIEKDEYSYDANNNVVEWINSKWNTSVNQLVNEFKSEQIYNTSGQLTADLTSLWDRTNKSWYYTDKKEFIFDSNGNKTLETYYKLNRKDSQFILKFKGNYYYSLHTLTDNLDISENQKVKLYPNPASEMVTLEISDRSVTHCELFNTNGQLLKTLPVEQGVNNYTIRDLKEGLYLVKIKSKEGTIVKKIIKN